MAIKICVLGSGSKGNSVLVHNGKNTLLIDCGLSARTMMKKLKDLNFSPFDIDGVLITHEHDDHVRSLDFMSKSVPVYAHEAVMDHLAMKYNVPLNHRMEFDREFSIGSLDIQPFSVSHDACFPLGFCIYDGQHKFTYATDLGTCGNDILSLAEGSSMVMIESNHDVDMLLKGSYPERLKRRIFSNKGHLSNENCAEAACRLAEKGARRIVLGHLSEQNNCPELAHWTTTELLKSRGASDISVFVANQYTTSGWLEG